jgi:ADP-ribosyl-[dinitrogen reductase] hydrolase
MSESASLSSRIKGAIFGLAICDALGGPVEFKARGSFPKVTNMQANKTYHLPAGCFTDDTSMALCLAHALVDNNGQSKTIDQVQRYIAWWLTGDQSSTGTCFDIGISTEQTLESWNNGLRKEYDGLKPDSPAAEDALASIQQRIIESFSDDCFCGNGSLMRVLPVSLVARSEADVVGLAAASSLPTHPHLRCVHACSLYSALAYRALNGASKDELAIRLGESVMDHHHPPARSNTSDTPLEPVLRERLQRYRVRKDWQARSSDDIRSTGYVVDSLEAALWAFFNTDTFEDGAILAVNLGDDADTVGAIYGGLAGAYYGFEAVPEQWLQDLRRKDLLDGVVQKILLHREKAV